MKVFAALAVLAGCHHATPPPPPPSHTATLPPAPTGFADCDFVTFDATSGALSTWALMREGPKLLGSLLIDTPIPDDPSARAMANPMHGEWADHNHLFARLRESKVVMITPAGISPIDIPDMSKLPPKPDENAEQGLIGMASIDLVVNDGEAWWGKCAWGYPYDGGFCSVWMATRLWPSPRQMTKLPDARDHQYPKHVPAGFTLEQNDALTCKEPSGATSTITTRGGPDEEWFYGQRWISANPPRMLVLYGPHAEFSSPPASRWEIHDGCTVKPLAEGDDPRAGLGDLWSGTDEHGFVIYRGATLVGHVKTGAMSELRFRP